MAIILHIDMNSFFASVEQAADPRLRGRPVAVGGGISKRTVVAAASYEAKAYGVKSGMPMWEARKLCPDMTVVTGDMSKYTYTSRELASMFREYTDLVEVFSIDEAFLDVTATAERFRGAINIATDIKRRIFERFRITCTVGIGPNKLLAKLAGELKKPDGLVVLNYDDVPAAFDHIKVSELCGVGRKLEVNLKAMGIATCGDLRRTPELTLVRRFGVCAGERLYMMGQGRDLSPVLPACHETDAKSMGHSYTLPRDTEDIDEVKRYLLHLSEQVGRRLRRDGYRGRTVHFYLRFGDFTGCGRQEKLDDYIDDGYEIYSRAVKIMDGSHIDRPIRFVGVALSSLVRGMDQMSLIREKESGKSIIRALDEINDRFGEFTVRRASLLRTALAEKSGMVEPGRYKFR